MTIDPIHQFQIKNLMPMVNMGGHQIAFTNSALFMFIIVAVVSILFIVDDAPRSRAWPAAIDR